MEANQTQMGSDSMLGNTQQLVAGNHGANGGDSSPFPSKVPTLTSSARGYSRSMPPPFLLKLYEIVGDQKTNKIISWSPSKRSLIIWDHNSFAAQILPKYFRHCNLSSFIYQLNNYGFRKVSWEHTEYANPWFVEGKAHWLKHIKRRDQETDRNVQEKALSTYYDEPVKSKTEEMLGILRTEQINLDLEMQQVKDKQEKLDYELAGVEESIQATHTEQEAMLVGFMADFVQQSVAQHLNDYQEMADSEVIDEASPESSRGSQNKVSAPDQIVDIARQDQVSQEIIKQKGESAIPSDDSGSSTQDQGTKVITTKFAEDMTFWAKILEPDSGSENGGVRCQSPCNSKSEMRADNPVMDTGIPTEEGAVQSVKSSDAEPDDVKMKLS